MNNDEIKPKIEINCSLQNKQAIERRLTEVLKTACKSLGFRVEEWDFDDALYRAIKSRLKHESDVATFDKYDSFYRLAEDLKVELDPKFDWFFNIKKHKPKLK